MDYKHETKDAKNRQASPLYRIKTPQGAISYIYGTFHIAQQLPGSVEKVCDIVSTVILEKNPNDTELHDYIRLFWQSDNPECYDFFMHANLSDDQISMIQERLLPFTYNEKLSVNELESLMNMMTPMHLFQMLATPKKIVDDTQKGCDALLSERAKANDKNIIGLESANDVQAMAQGLYLTFDEQLQFFNYSLTDILSPDFSTRIDKAIDQLSSVYQSAHLPLISACIKHNIMSKDFRNQLPALSQKIYDEAITKRDQIFFDGLKEPLENGDNLIAVGAAHLLGLLQLVLNSGSEITMIPADGNLEDDYPPITKQQLDYYIHLADYLFRTNWFDRQEPKEKVKQHLTQSFFNSEDARKMAKYIREGKHDMTKDEDEGACLDQLSKNWDIRSSQPKPPAY